MRKTGRKLSKILEELLDMYPNIQRDILKAIGAGKDTVEAKGPRQSDVDKCREMLSAILSASPQPSASEAITQLQPQVVEALIRDSVDPDVVLPEWLRRGAPTGIEEKVGSCGVFPTLREGESSYPDFPLNYISEEHVNYASMDSDPQGQEVLKDLVDAGYIMKLDTYDDLSDFLHGETPVMCKIALIVTEKNGVTKHRLILDCKEGYFIVNGVYFIVVGVWDCLIS